MTRALRTLAVLLLLTSTTACGGPDSGYRVGLREYPQDVVLGATATPAPTVPPRAPGANVTGPGSPGLIGPPLPVFPGAPAPTVRPSPVPTPPPPPCPSARKDARPSEPAQSEVTSAPAPGTYPYRQSGSYTYGSITTELPSAVERRVQNVKNPSDPVGGTMPKATWDVVEESRGTDGRAVATTTTSYQLTADTIDITRITTRYADGSAEDFMPEPPVRVFMTPAALYRGTTWEVQSVDPVNGVQMRFFARISQDKPVIDVCGTLVEAWRVEVLSPRTTPKGEQGTVRRFTESSYDIEGSWDIAPQYGGLVVANRSVTRNGMTTIDSIPFSSDRSASLLRVTPQAGP